MKVIVGLGNVGREYARTRHNIGFLVVEALAKRDGGAISQRLKAGRQVVALFGDSRIGGTPVRLLQPQTMMNLSGESLRALPDWGVEAPDLLIVCDDVNLPLGTLRLRPKGSAGGHKGLISCFEALGTQQVARLRLGVGATPLPKDLTKFVVTDFRDRERPVVARAIVRAAEACELWATQGAPAAMNRMNRSIEDELGSGGDGPFV